MKILGALILSMAPALFGAIKYLSLLERTKTLQEVYVCFYKIIDEIVFLKKELFNILKSKNTNFFIFSSPIKINKEYFLNQGLSSKEILIFEDFIKMLQKGDETLIKNEGELYLKKLDTLKNEAKEELDKNGKVIITTFLSFSGMVFLVLI